MNRFVPRWWPLWAALCLAIPISAALVPVDATSGFPTCIVTPGGYTKVTSSTNPITEAVKQAQPDALIQLSSGYFRRCGPFPSSRILGSAPVVIEGQGAATTLLRDTTVGSTDTILLGQGDHDTVWRNLYVQADDRSGIKSVAGTGPNHTFDHVSVFGFGNPTQIGWTDDSKWGIHTYDANNLRFLYCNVWCIFQEHAFYDHGHDGPVVFQNCSFGQCGRTATQFVNRMGEGAPGVGDITIKDCYVEDVCLEQGGGGSAFTFRGGMPTVDIVIDNTYVTLGGNAALAAPFNANITGAVVVDQGGDAHPGGTKSLTIKGCTFEVGKVHHGSGSAVRSCIAVSDLGTFTISNTRVEVHRDPSAHASAFSFGKNLGAIHILDGVVVIGGVDWTDGTWYPTFDGFKAAHPEVFQ